MGVASFLRVLKGTSDPVIKALIPMSDQISCFLIKKNLSPIVFEASVIEEMEIKISPISRRVDTRKISLLDFMEYLIEILLTNRHWIVALGHIDIIVVFSDSTSLRIFEG